MSGPSLGSDALTGVPLGDEGVYHPGDLGFVDDGHLYVCGRADDIIVTNGCNVYAPAIEAVIGDVDGIRRGRVTAVGLPTGDWAVVAEPSGPLTRNQRQADALVRSIRHAAVQVAASKPDQVVLVGRGRLPDRERQGPAQPR